MATNKPKHILIAPLDWGLGHIARCIPIIGYILSQGHVPVVAGNASQRSFIEETFGDIDIIHLEGYNITYSALNNFGQMGLLSQFPAINKTITTEQEWLLKLADERKIDGIISDNRYGLHHPRIPSVILTHQLQVQTGFGDFSDRIVQKLHYKYLNRFSATWVVDAEGIPNLGGKLSHPAALPRSTKYIGLLSRFEGTGTGEDKNGGLLILLSGPEPQRSILSQILWRQAVQYNGTLTFIEGSDTAIPPAIIPRHITYHKRLAAEQLLPILHATDMVVCRSGYSTVMDLIALRKKAVLIPTPAQTEQQYLGRHLHQQGIFYCTPQKGFDINTALKMAAEFPYHPLALNGAYTTYKEVINDWLQTL